MRALLGRLRDDLEELGDWDEVHALTEQALGTGTSALRQRAVVARGGDLRAVAQSVVDEAAPQG